VHQEFFPQGYAYHSSPFCAWVKNAWRYTFISPYLFMLTYDQKPLPINTKRHRS
jgi:hypothetical protein